MLALLNKTFNERAGSLRGPLIGIYSLLIAANLVVWIWAVLVFQNQPPARHAASARLAPSRTDANASNRRVTAASSAWVASRRKSSAGVRSVRVNAAVMSAPIIMQAN